MDWDKCTNPSCQVTYLHSEEVLACSNPKCGSPRPRCVLCNIAFVRNKYDLCYDCQDNTINLCDNCSKPQTRMYKTDMDEFWCFDCLQYYNEQGPALPVNKDILKVDKGERDKFDFNSKLKIDYTKQDCINILRKRKSLKSQGYKGSSHMFDTNNKKCMGCKYPIPLRDDPSKNNFCNVCLTLIKVKVCVNCFEEWLEDVGCDETGCCIECSTYKEVVTYAYGIGASGQERVYTPFSQSDNACINCGYEFSIEGSSLCRSCEDKIQSDE